MLCKYFSGFKDTVNVGTSAHHPLIFFKKVRQHPGERHRHRSTAVGHVEPHRLTLAAHQSALFHQAANAENLIRAWRFSHDLAGRAKEVDAVAHRIANQRRRSDQRDNREGDNLNAALLFQALHLRYPTFTGTTGASSAPRSPQYLTSDWRSATPARCYLLSNYRVLR